MNYIDLDKEALSVINDIKEAERSGKRIPLHKMSYIEARKSYFMASLHAKEPGGLTRLRDRR